MAVHDRAVTSVAIDPTSSLVASGSEDGVIRTWDVRTGQPMGELRVPESQGVWELAIDPTGTLLAAATGGQVRIWDLRTLQLVDVLGDAVDTPLSTLAFGPDGRMIVTATADGRIYAWDLDGRTARFLFDTDEVEGASDDVSTLAINADGSTLAVASSLLIEWDLGRNLITSTRTSPSSHRGTSRGSAMQPTVASSPRRAGGKRGFPASWWRTRPTASDPGSSFSATPTA